MLNQIKESPEELVDDFLAEVLPEEEIGGEIILQDPAQADHQIQKIARLKKKQDEISAFVAQQMSTLQTFHEKRLSVLQREIDWRSQPLEVYVRDAHRRSAGKTKSIDLPHGKLKLRAQQDKFVVDEDKIWAWVGDHEEESKDFIETKEIIRKDKLKDYIKQTGEMVEGVDIIPAGEPAFYLEIKGKEKGGAGNGQ